MGKKLTDESTDSKAFRKFKAYIFERKDDTSKSLFMMIDPSSVDGLNDEEKVRAEEMLKAALAKGYDRRWLWALGELDSESAYQFLLDLYNKEEATVLKVDYARTLLMMNTKAPVLRFLQDILKSKESNEIRKDAVGALYWLYDKQFDDKERQQLYLSILFDAMLDTVKDIRLYSYDILKDHYGMKQFTPLDDPVLKIISSKRKKIEYQKAAQIFEDRIRSIDVVPVSKRVVVKWIKALPSNPPTIKKEDCEVCTTIPDDLYADMAERESLNAYKSKLETAVKFAYYSNAVMRCPVCGQLYMYKYQYEFLVGGSEEEEWLFRTDTESVVKLVTSFLKSYDFKNVITCGNFLKISY